MDGELEQILKIRSLQERVNHLRSYSSVLYRRIIKKAHTEELNKVIHTNVIVDDVEVNIPEPSTVPPVLPVGRNLRQELDDLMEDYNTMSKAINLL